MVWILLQIGAAFVGLVLGEFLNHPVETLDMIDRVRGMRKSH